MVGYFPDKMETEPGILTERLREALEQQRATSEILAAISRSPFELDNTLQTILEQGIALCRADTGRVLQVVGSVLRERVKPTGRYQWVVTPWQPQTIEIDRGTLIGRAVLEARTQHAPDVRLDLEVRHRGSPLTRIAVPIKVAGAVVGVLNFHRVEVAPFSPSEIALIETFADQAAIAIENVRLFNETKEALEYQTATSEVLKAISRSAFDLQRVLDTVIASATKLTGASGGTIWRREGDEYRFAASSTVDDLTKEALRNSAIRPHAEGSVVARAALSGQPVQVEDAHTDPGYRSDQVRSFVGAGKRTRLAVPLLREGVPIGVLLVARTEVKLFTEKEIELVTNFADQAAIAMENTRLLNEIREQSLQLEAASRHKSEFLANMSHELRTPLNAIIGFSEVLEQRFFGELNERQADYTHDIATSGRHLLDLVNEILDLSKVEAGRMELETSDFDLAGTIHGALAFIRERAASHGIELIASLPEDLGTVVADERKIRQVLLNLLSNAVKFTPDGGRITLSAQRSDGQLHVSVQDTGIGIAAEDQPKVFEEFQQVGTTTERSREGTGLGLTLAKRFIELHGGRLWVDSELGKGSIFTFAIPVAQGAPAVP